mmetsp:Transcript_13001/g.32817  ORF Transcript_13001/g.32817 Transcript_13001/m.32817 type:complete len:116 (+) Transcript_13001:1507-1854(+)
MLMRSMALKDGRYVRPSVDSSIRKTMFGLCRCFGFLELNDETVEMIENANAIDNTNRTRRIASLPRWPKRREANSSPPFDKGKSSACDDDTTIMVVRRRVVANIIKGWSLCVCSH